MTMTVQRTKLQDLTVEDLDNTLDNVEPLKALQPGEVLGAVQQLRRFMTEAKSAGFLLYASFVEIGGQTPEGKILEEEVVKARRALEFTSARVAQLLSMLEKTPAYKEVVARYKTMRLEREEDEEDDDEEG